MKVVLPTCCGIDVHKSFLVATIIKTPTDNLQPEYQKKRFSVFNSELNRLADWLYKNECLDVCMESTGKYWVMDKERLLIRFKDGTEVEQAM